MKFINKQINDYELIDPHHFSRIVSERLNGYSFNKSIVTYDHLFSPLIPPSTEYGQGYDDKYGSDHNDDHNDGDGRTRYKQACQTLVSLA